MVKDITRRGIYARLVETLLGLFCASAKLLIVYLVIKPADSSRTEEPRRYMIWRYRGKPA